MVNPLRIHQLEEHLKKDGLIKDTLRQWVQAGVITEDEALIHDDHDDNDVCEVRSTHYCLIVLW